MSIRKAVFGLAFAAIAAPAFAQTPDTVVTPVAIAPAAATAPPTKLVPPPPRPAIDDKKSKSN